MCSKEKSVVNKLCFLVLFYFVFSIFQAKVVVAEQTEKDIDETRSQYIPVAVRTQILFFCTYDLVRNLFA